MVDESPAVQGVELDMAVQITKTERTIVRPGALLETVTPETLDITPQVKTE